MRHRLQGTFAVLATTTVCVLLCLGVGAAGARPAAPGKGKVAPALAALAARSAADAELRVIVQGAGARSAAAVHGQAGKGLDLVGGVAATVRAGQLQRLAAAPGVTFVAPDAPIALAAEGGVSTSNLATIFPGRASVSNPWNAGAIGRGVGIAVIDSGVTPSVDFGTRLVQVRLDGQDGSLDDTVGHGSLVAGVAAGLSPDGRFIGIAPGATVYALNVSRPAGVYTSDVITALKWVFDNAHTYNIRVVNLSLTETVKSSYTESVLDLAVERLWAAGVFVTVAAGNRGAGEIDYAPANDPLVFTVGAFDTMDTSGPGDDRLSPWSAGGKTVDGFAKPDLVAPGRHIAGPLPAGTALDQRAPAGNRVAAGYTSINGTSFAAPQVAGAAAIIFGWHPDYSPDNVKWVLIAKQGAKPKDSKVGALSLSSSYNLAGTPGRANQGVPALVCAPGDTCTTSGTIASTWDSSSWTASSWNGSTWNASSWNGSSWTSTADWDASSWTASSWNASSWNATSWNGDADAFDLWG
ncbi:MAG: S8 family serine peptidase [Pseudomonadota bacterium]